MEDLAREAGASRTVLAERFNAVLGQAPIEYVTSWRMQLAAERIRSSNDSFAAIAADVGYVSEAAFNRAFKRVTGVTPGRWRDSSAAVAADGAGPKPSSPSMPLPQGVPASRSDQLQRHTIGEHGVSP